MRLTPRDRKVLRRLAAGRWLSTRQVAALCFAGVSMEMARRCLRRLAAEGHVRSHQTNSMAEALHTLGPAGRDALQAQGWVHPIRLERTPPHNLEHFMGINDIRVAVVGTHAHSLKVSFFFACWELQQQSWPYRVIPDAACELARGRQSVKVLFEYDRGEESAGYVARTKFRPYSDGLEGFPFGKVVVVADAEQRLEQLRELAAAQTEPDLFGFVLKEELAESHVLAGIFH